MGELSDARRAEAAAERDAMDAAVLRAAADVYETRARPSSWFGRLVVAFIRDALREAATRIGGG